MDPFKNYRRPLHLLIWSLLFLGLYLTSLYSYPLFHSLAEIFSIIIACGIFMIAWNSRQFLDNNYLLFVGIAYLFVGGLDLIHTLGYKGMGVFKGYETNLPTQLWIAARYVQSLSLLIAPFFFRRKLKINFAFFGYAVAISLLLISIFYWDIFPICFIEGGGLTPFKKISEYIISLILLGAIGHLLKNRKEFDKSVLRWVVWSIVVTIVSELAFTFYIHAYGFSNLIGHYFKILSFYFIYKALIETSLSKPYNFLFRNLKQSEEALRESSKRIDNILSSISDGFFTLDNDLVVTYFNSAACRLLGRKEGEVLGRKIFDAFPEARGSIFEEKCTEAIRNKKDMVFEVYFGVKPYVNWYDVRVYPLEDGISVYFQVTTERKRAEEVIVHLASFPQLNPNPIVEVDLTGYVSYFNSAAKQLFPDLQIVGLQHPWLAGLESLSEMSERQGKRFHVRELKIGDIWYEQTIHCVSEGKRLRIYGLDITERKEAEGALKNALEGSKQRGAEISALLEGSRAVLEYHEFKDSAQSIFNSCKNLIGATAGYIALLSKDGAENEVLFLDSGGLSCTVDPSLPMPIRGLREEAYRTGKTVFHNDFSKSEYVKFMPMGHADLHNVLFAPMVIKEKVTGLLGLANKPGGFTENDARMASAFGELAAVALQNSRTLEALENSEERYRSVVRTANDAIISVDRRGHIIFWNNSAETVFGYSFDEVMGKPLTFIIPEQFRKDHQQGMNQMILTGQSKMIGKTVEVVGLRKDGSEFPVELSLATWKTGEETFFTGIIRNITERKKMGEELRQSRDELETRVQERTVELKKAYKELEDQSRILDSFFKFTITPLVLLDRNFNFIRVNKAYAKGCQRDISEFAGRNHFELYPHEENEAIFRRVVETKEPFQAFAKPFTFLDHPEWGTTYWDWILTPILDNKGDVEYLVFALEDVTDRTRAADKLEEQANLLELAHDAIITCDMDGTIRFWNHGAEEIYGWTKEEAAGKLSHTLLQTEFPKPLDEIIIDLIWRGRWEGELVHTRRDGKEITVASRWALQKDEKGIPVGILEINNDITERKQAEEAVKAERQRFNDLLEILPVYLVLLTPDYHVSFANRFFRERFGESHGRRCFEYLFGRSEPCEICETYTALKNMGPHEWEWTGPDGRNYDVFDFPFTDTDGSTLILEMGIDITERKRAEEALKATSLYARSLIEASLDPLVTISKEGKVTDVNRATELVTGTPRDELIGSDFSDYFTEPERAREGYQEVFLKGMVRDYSLAIRHKSGPFTEVVYNATVYKNEAGEVQGIFAAARDVTERNEIERRTHATNALLNLFAKIPTRKEYLDAVLELVQSWCRCRCAGIRVLDRDGYIPYESYRGFGKDFWESENWLSIQNDQCVCIRVVRGEIDPQETPVITPSGSFCCGNTVQFVEALSELEKSRYRGLCIRKGFLSVAIIPIRYRGKILGAIHLADEAEGKMNFKSVEFIESMAPLIGEAVNRFNLEDEIRESENRLRLLSSQLLTVQENERRQVARDLHDGIGQMLSAIKFKIEDTLQKKGKGRAKLMAEDIHTLIPMIRESIEEVRRIQMDLRPSTLDDLGIVATISWFCREFQKIYSTIRIEKQLDVQENEISVQLKTVTYRILQEAMNNIAKHSKANLIRLAMRRRGPEVELVIEDNGIGFDLENYRKGLGLESMKERAQLSGGTLVIESTIGKGTTIKASWTT